MSDETENSYKSSAEKYETMLWELGSDLTMIGHPQSNRFPPGRKSTSPIKTQQEISPLKLNFRKKTFLENIFGQEKLLKHHQVNST